MNTSRHKPKMLLSAPSDEWGRDVASAAGSVPPLPPPMMRQQIRDVAGQERVETYVRGLVDGAKFPPTKREGV